MTGNDPAIQLWCCCCRGFAVLFFSRDKVNNAFELTVRVSVKVELNLLRVS